MTLEEEQEEMAKCVVCYGPQIAGGIWRCGGCAARSNQFISLRRILPIPYEDLGFDDD